MLNHLPPDTSVTLPTARLHELHTIALRYAYLVACAERGVRQRGGTSRWSLPYETLPHPAATFDEAVDLARAHWCAGCEAGEGEQDEEQRR